jgi:hypothetical protein
MLDHLEKLGMKHVTGDEAVYYYRINDKIEGCIVIHVDDFLAVGSPVFFKNVTSKLEKKFEFGKIKTNSFRLCGMDIEVKPDGIYISQNDYTESMEEIQIDKDDDPERQLNRKEYTNFRKVIGQFIWLNEQTRPDLSFDTLSLSFNNKNAQVKHLLEANKNIRKAKSRSSSVKFSHIGMLENLKLLAYSDASHLTIEERSKGVCGKILFLSNKEETLVSPLFWKSKTIVQACTSAKAAETRAAYSCSDDAVGLARAINEIYTGKRGEAQIEVTMKCDSASLKDTLNSTKQIEEKLLRPTILAMKQMLARKQIGRFDWVESLQCHADALTKKGAKTSDNLLAIISTGVNN